MNYETYYQHKRRGLLKDRAILMKFAEQNPSLEQQFNKRFESDCKKVQAIMSVKDMAKRHKLIAENIDLFE